MIISILKVGDNLNDVVFTKEMILSIIENNNDKELLGEINDEYQLSNPHKMSHFIKNLRYNNILDSLDCDIIPLNTPYGQHLQLIYKHKMNIRYIPIFVKDNEIIKLKTVNITK